MRHGKKVNHLSRKTAHRSAMLANMACSLIEHKRINTTVAKAKALKLFIEPLITKSKAENNKSLEKGTHNRRIVFKNLRDKYAVSELFSTVAEKVGDRPGGYTRIIKLGNRLGDNADMAMIELVDFNEVYNAGKAKKKKSTRRGRSSKKAQPAAEAAQSTEEVEAPKAPEAKKEEKAEPKAKAEAQPKAEEPKAKAPEKDEKKDSEETKSDDSKA